MKRHPDILDIGAAAERIGVSVSWLRHGNGPKPLPGFGRRVRYSATLIDEWLEARRRRVREEAPWDYTSGAAARTPDGAGTSGGAGSKSPDDDTLDEARGRRLAETLLRESGPGEPRPSPGLRVVDGER